MKHKVLSVKQPWSFLICSGIKDIENRTWRLPEKYKGERVLIHASANPESWQQFTNYIENLDPENLELQRIIRDNSYSKLWLNSLETSAIIGSVRFVDCVINHPSIWAEKTSFSRSVILNNDLTVKGYRVKEEKPIYNWVATDAVLFDKPILNVKGKLSFWDYDLPDEYVELINEFDKQK